MARKGKLAGRTALITGGSRGIGAAIARAFAAEGADVGFCHNDDDDGASDVEAAIRAQGGRAFSWRCDLSDMAAARRLFADAETALSRVDILVNNAGVSEEKAVEAITLQAVDWMLNVHFKATFVLSQLAYVGMKRAATDGSSTSARTSPVKGLPDSPITAPPRPRCSASRERWRRRRRPTESWSTPSRRANRYAPQRYVDRGMEGLESRQSAG
jgi:3-oxoacyl-[acyl-carrier protein] reductase